MVRMIYSNMIYFMRVTEVIYGVESNGIYILKIKSKLFSGFCFSGNVKIYGSRIKYNLL